MDPLNIDISIIARDLKIAPEHVIAANQLLDDDNTIPFITRFRKDETGGLDEEQLLEIKTKVAQLRALADRKATILRAIESQGELSDGLKEKIQKTTSSRRLEDIYSPYKTKKQSRATTARQQGLAPLAEDIFSENTDVDFATRATDFVRVDKGLNSVDDVIKGVADLVAERFAENDTLRKELRKLVRDKGKLTSQAVVAEVAKEEPAKQAPAAVALPVNEDNPQKAAEADATEAPPTTNANESGENAATSAKQVVAEPEQSTNVSSDVKTQAIPAAPESDAESNVQPPSTGEVEAPSVSNESGPQASPTDTPAVAEVTAPAATSDDVASVEGSASNQDASSAEPQPAAPKTKRKKKKKKKKEKDPFKDYHDFSQPLSKTPHYRVLAINRGERSGKLKVKIKIDLDEAIQLACKHLVPENHPSAEFLKKCAVDTLNRSLLPSIEREIRREITEAAERHAVDVFAANLKNLLLQPPVRNRVVLAIDPGYKRGCSVAVLDACGNLVDSGQVFVVGNQNRRTESRQRITDWVKNHKVDIIAIGNGSGSREVEQMVSDTIAESLTDQQVTYIIINEAGTSAYSTSETGREELPEVPPATRAAVSIGRRLMDPLSELVKIAPANIGVGLYQHDVKAKHLSESLDAIVQFAVNRVGVDVNTASASILKHVAGLNALTARRVVEYRQQHGRFNSREELKNVSGIGDMTFVQAAGFLRIFGGNNPLDATSIHPECYGIAHDVLDQVSAKVEEVFPRWLMQPSREETAAELLKQQQAEKSAATQSAEPTKTSTDSPSTDSPSTDSPSTESPSDAKAALPAAGGAVVPSDESKVTTAVTEPPETPASPETPESDAASESTNTPESTAAPESGKAPESSTAPESDATADSASEPTDTSTPAEVKPADSTSDAAADPSKSESSSETSSINRREFEARRKEITKALTDVNVDEMAKKHGSGRLLVKDVVMSLKRPAWDPRDKARKPIFRRGILKIEDLKEEMQLEGQIVNVVDFGVFVDIGLGESSLVHVSQLSNHYLPDPYKQFSIGNVLRVWVTEIDSKGRRVKLTAVRPGASAKKPQRAKPKGRPKGSAQTEGSEGANKRRPQRSKRKPGKYEGSRSAGTSAPRRDRRKAAPKPVKPITDKMLSGDEPMTSFSDLAQFVKKKPQADDPKQDGKKQDSKKEN